MERKIKGSKQPVSSFSIPDDDTSNSPTDSFVVAPTFKCCHHEDLLDTARFIVRIENLEKEISSSRWQNVKNGSEEALEAAEDLRELILDSSRSLFPPSNIFQQTRFKEENLISRLLSLSVKLRVYKEVLGFLKNLMAYRHSSWPKRRKFNVFQDLMSSPDVWGKMDEIPRKTIIKICGRLLLSWIVEICRLFNPRFHPFRDNPIPIQEFRPDVFTCIKMFFLVEKNRLQMEQWKSTLDLKPLIVKLPVSVLMDLVLELHEQEPMIRPKSNVNESSVIFYWYRDLCRRLFRKSVLPVKCRNVATRLLNILLELGDELCFKPFASNLCRAFLAPHSFAFLRIFLEDEKIQRALQDSPIALNCFEQIVESWSIQSQSRVESLNLCRPKAVVANHPVVEAFLRSSMESMEYMNFSNIAEAQKFAENLEKTQDNVSVNASGNGKSSKCFIRKCKAFLTGNIDYETREVAKLVKLRNRIAPKKSAKPPTLVPPPKRSKLDTPVIVKLE